MVAIPTMTNRVTIQVLGLLDALRQSAHDSDAAFDVNFQIEMGKAPVEFARNVLCGGFLRSNCEKLWFIDEDMLPEASAARLLHSDLDIISARMYKFDHPNPFEGKTVGLGLCAMTRKANGLYQPKTPEVGEPAIQECDAVGTACTVIARRVLEDRRMWTDNVYTTVEGETIDGNEPRPDKEYAPAIFRYLRAPSGAGLMGEDVDFCERAKTLGYSIGVDLNAICGHFKPINIDDAGFLAQETLKRAVAGIVLEDGRTIQVDVAKAIKDSQKRVDGPPLDKMVHAEQVMVK
jgi:hypothetical protein